MTRTQDESGDLLSMTGNAPSLPPKCHFIFKRALTCLRAFAAATQPANKPRFTRCQRGYKTVLMLLPLLVRIDAASAQTADPASLPSLVVIVRHAEKASTPADDPPLTPAGTRRAGELARALEFIKFDGVLTSQKIRTIRTAERLVAAQNLNGIQVQFDGNGDAARIKDAAANFKGKVVLLVSHSELIDDIIVSFGGPKMPKVCANAYDNIFVILPRGPETRLMRLRYGEVSPPRSSGCM